jgi:hypothetical protein
MTFAPQEPISDEITRKLEELTRRVEALEKERARLMEQVTTLEKFGEEAAETISRLKKMVQNGTTRGPAPAEKADPAGVVGAEKAADPGPLSPVHGKVLSVATERGFMIINLGSDDGVKEGWTFEVIRTNKDKDGNNQNELLGKAVFEKFVETRPSGQSKLKIVEGDPEKMKYGDSVVANRRLDPIPVKEAVAAPELPTVGPRKIRIVGATGDTYFLNAGSKDKLKQSDKVYIYRDKRAIAQLRLDQVGPDFAAGKIIDGTKLAEPANDDEVSLKDLKTSIVGKVKRIEATGAATGAWIEVGKVQGVKQGMQFEVRRQGKLLGRLVVKDGGPHHSVCEAVAPLTLEELRMDDFVESAE